ncbi:hypothetical protein [Rossellomorea aquimaris]|nr:hypothetical protein [Rossellomorea aquimaris]
MEEVVKQKDLEDFSKGFRFEVLEPKKQALMALISPPQLAAIKLKRLVD